MQEISCRVSGTKSGQRLTALRAADAARLDSRAFPGGARSAHTPGYRPAAADAARTVANSSGRWIGGSEGLMEQVARHERYSRASPASGLTNRGGRQLDAPSLLVTASSLPLSEFPRAARPAVAAAGS